MELSKTAQEVLGFIVSHLGPEGVWSMKRAEVEEALGISSATLTRALRELREAGLLKVVEQGGGAGRPTKYRLTLPQAEQEKTPAREPTPAGDAPTPRPVEKPGKPAHVEHVHEQVHGELRTAGVAAGETAISFLSGVLEGGTRKFLSLPKWQQALLVTSVGALGGWLAAGWAGVEDKGARAKWVLVGATTGLALALLLPSPEPAPLSAQGAAGAPVPALWGDRAWPLRSYGLS